MANLVSPGVEVSVIDESFYTPATAGTIPMFFVVSAENKQNSSGTGTARGTTKQNAGVPFLLTSQRDLADTFGDPVFQTDNNNNPINGGELNEYGLQAAYSVLGVTNRAWVTRADLDLSQLEPSVDAPAAEPLNGTYWLDTDATQYGVFEWNGAAISEPNGQTFTAKTPIVVTEENDIATTGAPKKSIGAVGDYAVVFDSSVAKLYFKSAGNTENGVEPGDWVVVGSDEWIASHPTVRGSDLPESGDETDYSTTGTNLVINGTLVDTQQTTATGLQDFLNNTLSISGLTFIVTDEDRIEIYSDGTSNGAGDSTLGGPVVIENPDDELGLPAGTFYPPSLQIAPHTDVPRFKVVDAADLDAGIPQGTSARPTGSVWLKTTEPGGGARWRMKVYNSQTQLWEEVDAPLYDSNASAIYNLDIIGGGTNIPNGGIYVKTNVAADALPLATFKVYKRDGVAPTTVTGAAFTEPSASVDVTIRATQPGQQGYVVGTVSVSSSTDADDFAGAVNGLNITGLTASVDAQNRITLRHATGGEIQLQAPDGETVLSDIGFTTAIDGVYNMDGWSVLDNYLQASLWNPSNSEGTTFYVPSPNEVTTLTADGALWYSSVVDEVDLMIHNGTTWVGYQNGPYTGTDPNGPIVSASRPTSQSNGDDLVTGDIWINTLDIDEYPVIYRYDANLPNTRPENRWIQLDTTDQTSENGVLFADARWATSGGNVADNSFEQSTISELLTSDFLDPDAPDPALYPRGMILWNLRRSGFNVKRFERNYIDQQSDNPRQGDVSMEEYYPHRWVTESANQADGSGSFGAKAQRKVVVQALQALLNSNDSIRDKESREFNLMASPGYPELIGEMITLNFDRDLSAFIVGDSPATLEPNATALNTWATNQNLAVEDNGNGLVSRDEYLGIFYPWGFTSDNFGNNVAVPPSHMITRTIVLSDQVSFPWFAPAGIRRGGITNATSVGYIDNEGEFNSIALNEGQRDVLYENNVNPITFLSGSGLVNYGQKTRARGASALDRINVARLVVFLRGQLNQLAKPYIFEQNDKVTRDEIKQATESLLLELVGQRALFDFLVVCDESNNTPARIDRNELYVDIAIEPVKAVEFIYIPLRLKNTGEIDAL
jgi:hypothetical protein